MTTHPIDNSDNGYIERTILWQYDNAEHLKDLILNLKGFYDRSTKDHFDEMVGRMNLADENIDDYGLAVWGKILNTNRPNLTYGDNTTPLSKGVYRKILLGKIRLFEGSATLKEFAEYIKSIFSDGVTCTDGPDATPPDASFPDMSLRFIKNPDSTIWSESDAPELDALITQAPDVVFVYPAGVRSSEYSDSPVIGFAEQVRVDSDGSVVGLFNPSRPVISITNTTLTTIILPVGFWFVYAGVRYEAQSKITLDPGKTNNETLVASVDGSFVPIGEKVLLHTDDSSTNEILYGVVSDSGISRRSLTAPIKLVATPPDFNLETLSNGSIAWKR